MPRTGRPKVDNPKRDRVTIRFSEEQISQLEAYADKYHLKKAQVLMKGFEELLRQERVMGHSDISTTMDIYAEATEEKKQEIMASLQGKIII